MTPEVSIIIRTLNEARYLPDLLLGIQNQESDFSYEIILIDSGSTDNTLSIAEHYNCRILHISREEFSFGRSLNRACEAAYGDYLVIVSGHCIPFDNNWLQNLVKPLSNSEVDYIYGRQIGGAETYWSEQQIFSKYFPEKSQLPQSGFYCNNANSAIRKQVWSQYLFDEELTGLEDMHLAKRLINSSFKIGYVATSCVYHLHNESWPTVQKRFERESLALKTICPEVIMRRSDAVRYFFRAVLSDILASLKHCISINWIIKIFRYRYHQYNGSYIGNHLHRRYSKRTKESYFYPTDSKGPPLYTN